MIKIPNLTAKISPFSSYSSTDMEKVEENQELDSTFLKQERKYNYCQEDIIMEIQHIEEPQPQRDQKVMQEKNTRDQRGNFERFRLIKQNFSLSSEESEEDPKESHQDTNKFHQNIFFTQILDSKVFHRSVIEAAKTSAQLQDTLLNSCLTFSHEAISENLTKNPHKRESSIILYSTDVQLLMKTDWCPERVMVKTDEIRFSEFSMSLEAVSKIKIFRSTQDQSLLKVRLTVNEQNYLLGISPKQKQDQFMLFASIIKAKLAANGFKTCHQTHQQASILQNKLMKKSQFLCKWEERIVSIQHEELSSFKQSHSKPTFKVKKGSIKQLWTRFEFINSMLIIKISHSLKKTQFGIPLTDFCSLSSSNWLYIFYILLQAH